MLPVALTRPLWWVARWVARMLTGVAVAAAFTMGSSALPSTAAPPSFVQDAAAVHGVHQAGQTRPDDGVALDQADAVGGPVAAGWPTALHAVAAWSVPSGRPVVMASARGRMPTTLAPVTRAPRAPPRR